MFDGSCPVLWHIRYRMKHSGRQWETESETEIETQRVKQSQREIGTERETEGERD